MAVIPCGSKFFVIMVIVLLMQEAIAQENDDVIVSPSCSSQSCRTLSQTPSLTSSHLSLILLPGNHTISSTLSFRNEATFFLEGVSRETTFVICTDINVQYRYSVNVNIEIRGSVRVSISNITFQGCNLSISRSNNIDVSNTRFLNAYNRVLGVYNSFNIKIDRSHFDYNHIVSDHYSILALISKNFAITQSKFTNNVVSTSYSSVFNTGWSVGVISCCNFTNNSVMDTSGQILRLWGGSLVTNSTFLSNNLMEFGEVIAFSGSSPATVISCVFRFNILGSFGSVIFIHGTVLASHNAIHGTVLASEFSHNVIHGTVSASESSHNGGHLIDSWQSNTVIGCSQFHNNSNTDNRDFNSHVQLLSNNSIGCSRYAIGEDGVCTGSNCEGMHRLS